MNVGLATLRFRVYSADSIKEKRSIVKRLLADVRRRGPAFAVCEMDDHDDLRRLTICVAHRLQAEFERGHGYEIVESEIEIL
jgi:uncharacterized protein YlxP (DUF503 family)